MTNIEKEVKEIYENDESERNRVNVIEITSWENGEVVTSITYSLVNKVTDREYDSGTIIIE